MTIDQKTYSLIIIWAVSFIALCFAAGSNNANRAFDREIIELKIELTKLEIKKLKGNHNDLHE